MTCIIFLLVYWLIDLFSSRSTGGDTLSVALSIRTLSVPRPTSLSALHATLGVALSGEKALSSILLASFGLGGHFI